LSPLIDLAADGEVPRGTSPSAAAKYFSAKFILGAEEVDMRYSDMFKDGKMPHYHLLRLSVRSINKKDDITNIYENAYGSLPAVQRPFFPGKHEDK